jgi:hypothetical protein
MAAVDALANSDHFRDPDALHLPRGLQNERAGFLHQELMNGPLIRALEATQRASIMQR